MNYLVCIKQVPDTTTKMLIEADNTQSLNLANIKWIINPYDEMALEEALLLAEKAQNKGQSSRVDVCSLGPARVKDALKTALAMGAHRAIHIETEVQLDSLSTAQAIYQSLGDIFEDVDLILAGKLSIDGGFGMTGPMLASYLKCPSVSSVVKVEQQEDSFKVSQSLDGGQANTFTIKKPCLLSVTKGINTPRYPTLPGIMKAKSKPFETRPLPASIQSSTSIERFEYPKSREAVEMIEGSPKEQVQKLLQILKEKEGVL